MSDAADLLLLRHIAARGDDAIDLAEAALLLATLEYEGLDVGRKKALLTTLCSDAAADLRMSKGAPPVRALLQKLFQQLGFRGNQEDYYDPRNSFLNDVIDRRVGIPITLAIVIIEACGAAGIDAYGISYPGHFLVGARSPAGLSIIDPFRGRVLAANELDQIEKRGASAVDPRTLPPAPKLHILLRVLENLRGIYGTRNDAPRLSAVLERMNAIAPSAALRKEIEGLSGGPARGASLLN